MPFDPPVPVPCPVQALRVSQQVSPQAWPFGLHVGPQ